MIGTSVLFLYGLTSLFNNSYGVFEDVVEQQSQDELAAAGSIMNNNFIYNFNADGILQESATSAESSSPYWWLDSGGRLKLESGVGRTVSGSLPATDKWRRRYLKTSSLDTAGGHYPQNLFRLVTKQSWQDLDQSVRVRLDNLNQTPTPNRGEWSGLFLMSRYVDKDNLYYAGIRMDGAAVIKKKYHGIYYTLAYEKVFNIDAVYHREVNPNLLPMGKWLGIKSVVKNNADGSVQIDLQLDQGEGYKTVLNFRDDNAGGVPAIRGLGRAGLRSDFLDVSFDDYHATEV